MKKRRPQRREVAPHPDTFAAPEANPNLTSAVLEMVDKQLRSSTPPETQQTFDRLVAQGYTREGARQLIANVVVHEVFRVMSQGKPYDQERYIAALQRLPALPEDDYTA